MSLHDALISQIGGKTFEPADFTHPGDYMDAPEEPMMTVREAMEAVAFVILEIRGADNARMTVDCFAGAIGALTYENRSMADIARSYGKSREAIRKRIENCQEGMGIIGSTFQKRSEVGETYSKCNRRNHKN